MSLRAKSRLIALQVAIGAVLLILGYAEYRTIADWFAGRKSEVQNFDQLLARYNAIQAEYFQMANYIESAGGDLRQALLRFATRNDREEWDRFQRKSREFTEWIATQK